MSITKAALAIPLFFGCLVTGSGCFSPKINEGVICGEGDSCPAGMQCDPADGRCRFELLDLGDDLRILPETFDFGSVVQGNASSPSTFSVLNLGQSESGTLQVSIPDDSSFQILENNCRDMTLPPEGSCTLTARFEPLAAGVATSALTVTDNASIGRADLTGTGLAPGDLSIAPDMHLFGDVPIGDFSGPTTFTVTNNGDDASGDLALSLEDTTTFTVVQNGCGTSPLMAGASCDIQVEFHPTLGGNPVSSILVQADPGGAASASFNGYGVAEFEISHKGPVAGTVVSSPVGLNCGSDCQAPFSVETLTLTAISAGDAVFDHWEGIPGCEETQSICEATLDAPQITAQAAWRLCMPMEFLRCSGANQMVLCGDDISEERIVDCEFGCNPDFGRCNECVPGTTFCASNNSEAICTEDGTIGIVTLCMLGTCEDGACQGTVEPGP